MKSKIIKYVLALVLFPIYAWGANCGGATPCACGDTITSSYTLTADLTCADSAIALAFGANDVTLDLSGHTIRGDDSTVDVAVQVDGFTGAVIKNGTFSHLLVRAIEIKTTSTATIQNIVAEDTILYSPVDFTGSSATILNDAVLSSSLEHCVGMHNSATLVSSRVTCNSPKFNAIHSIDTTSADLSDWVVNHNNANVGFYPAFYIEGTGTNIIRRPKIHIATAQRGAFSTSPTAAATTTVISPVVVFNTGVNGFNFAVYAQGNTGTMTIHNPTFYNGTTNAACQVIRATGSGDIVNINNGIFHSFNRMILSTSDSNVFNLTNILAYNTDTLLEGDTAGYVLKGTMITSDPQITLNGKIRRSSPCYGGEIISCGAPYPSVIPPE
jgi:hypothetical protein